MKSFDMWRSSLSRDLGSGNDEDKRSYPYNPNGDPDSRREAPAEPKSEVRRWFNFGELCRPRILLALAVWMLLIHAIALYLGTWFAITSYEFISEQLAHNAEQSNPTTSAEWAYGLWATIVLNMVGFYAFGLAPLATLLLGLALVVVRVPWWRHDNRWVWTAVGAIAGIAVGRSWLHLAMVIVVLGGTTILPQQQASPWAGLAAVLMIGVHYGAIWFIPMGVIQGVICTLIFRRLALAKTARSS